MANKKTPSARKVPATAKAGADRRAELRAQQEAAAKKARRKRLIVVIAIVVVVALIAGLVIWGVSRLNKDSSRTINHSGTQITPPDGNSTDLSQAAWITVPGTTPAKSTALRVDIHFDYQCPWCKLVEDTYAKAFESLANSGDITLNLHNLTFLDHGFPNFNSTAAAIAASCVDYADDTKFYAYNNTIFANQPSTEGGGYTDKQLTVDFPASIGLTGDALAKFNTCYSTGQTYDWVNAVENNNTNPVADNSGSMAFLYGSNMKMYVNPNDPNSTVYYDDATKGNQVGVPGTPTIFVNGKSLNLNDLFVYPDATSAPTPAIGTDAASLLTLLQTKANS